ncbi:RidA family protein [Naumannella sp. ID2617S]|nr:RidA family protein [Naumannella sp. ID2617S]
MNAHLFSPEGMLAQTPYHHVAIARGATQIHVAGQVGGPDGDSAPLAVGDLAQQVAQALRNTARGLAGANATFADVVRLTFYVTQWRPEKIGDFMTGVQSVADEVGLPTPMPPASLIGVAMLYQPDVLVEVEATAVLP